MGANLFRRSIYRLSVCRTKICVDGKFLLMKLDYKNRIFENRILENFSYTILWHVSYLGGNNAVLWNFPFSKQ